MTGGSHGAAARVINGGELTLSGGLQATVTGSTAYGLLLRSGTVMGGGDFSLTANGQKEASGIEAQGGTELSITAGDFAVRASASEGEALGVSVVSGSGGGVYDSLRVSAENLSIHAKGVSAVGAVSNWGSSVTLTAEKLLTVESESIESRAIGLLIDGYTGDKASDFTVDAPTIEISASDAGSTSLSSYVNGVRSRANERNGHSLAIGTKAAQSVTISAESTLDASAVAAVNVLAGRVEMGNAKASVALSASNATENADAVSVSGSDAALTLTAEKLTVSAYSARKGTGIRVMNNGQLAVAAETAVTVTGGTDTDHAADGIRVSNNIQTVTDAATGESVTEITPAASQAVFEKAVTVQSDNQGARGASVLVGGATIATEADQGGLLSFKDALTVKVTSGANASGVEIDNNFLNGTRTGVTVTSTAGAGAKMVINGVLTANVTGGARAAGARMINGGVLTVLGGMTAEVTGDNAYGLLVTKGRVAAEGAVNLTATGSNAAYGIALSDSTAAIGSAGQAVTIAVSGPKSYALDVENSSLSFAGDVAIASGLIRAVDSTVEFKGALRLAGGLDSVESGTLSIAGSYITVSSDIFTNSAETLGSETGGLRAGVADKIAFASGSQLVLEDASYTLEYLTDAESQFVKNTPSIVMTGTLVEDLKSDALEKLPQNTVLVTAELKAEGNLSLDDDKVSGSLVGVGSVALGGQSLVFASDNGKTLNIVGNAGSLVSGNGPVTISVEKKATLAIGCEKTQGGTIEGSLKASGSAKISVSGDKGSEKTFEVSGALTLDETATLEVRDSSKLTVGELHVAPGATITVGSSEASGVGKLVSKVMNLMGKAFFDPIWVDGVENPSQVAVETLNVATGGEVAVGRNATLSLGTTDETAALAAVHASGHQLLENDVTAAMLLKGTLSVGSGSILVDGTLSKAPTASGTAGTVTVADKALLALRVDNDLATGVGKVFEGATLNLSSGAYLYVDLTDVTSTQDLTITLADTVNSAMPDANITANSALWYGYRLSDGVLTASYDPTSKLVEAGLIAPNTTRTLLSNNRADAVSTLIAEEDFAGAARAANKSALLAVGSAASVLALNTGNMIVDSVEARSAERTALGDKTGTALWIHLNGRFSKASSYAVANTSYGFRSDLSGITLGADRSVSESVTLGAAASFGLGSARGQGAASGIKNDVNYFGVSLYGVLDTPYALLTLSAGLTESKNEIKASGLSAKPDARTVSLGLRAEKAFSLSENLSVTPHAGIRYFNVHRESVNAGDLTYSAKNANVVQVPLGVAFKGNLKASCGAAVTPFLDLTVSPSFGDKFAKERVAYGAASDAFEARIADRALYSAKVGLEAVKGNHALGAQYGVGAASHGRLDQALQVRYRYSF